MNQKISVVVVTYNSSHVIEECLQPLANREDIDVIVVDNASSDSTLAKVADVAPNAIVLANDENIGFARAVNQAAQQVGGNCLCLLNPDARVAPSDLTELAEFALMNDAVVGPRIEHPQQRLKILSAGKLPTAWRMFNHYFGLSRIPGNFDFFRGHYLLLGRHTADEYDVEWVTGACMVMPTSLFQELGGLSQRWFMYAEDIEFCYRALLSKHLVVLKNDVSIEHAIGSSDSSAKTSVNPAWVVNLYDFYSSSICRSKARFYAWGIVVSLGLLTRSGAYLAMSLAGDLSRRNTWRVESRKFFIYATSVMAMTREGRGGVQTVPEQPAEARSWRKSA